MPRKNDFVRKIDQRPIVEGAGGVPLKQEISIAPPAIASLPAPDTLTYVTQGIQRSTQAPLAYVSISWNSSPNTSPDYYIVEWSTDSGFADVQRKQANQTSATIEGLAVSTTYYFRVQAVKGGRRSDFTDSLSVAIDPDTTIPAQVSSAAAAFKNSDLVITWTKPASEVFKHARILIYDSGHSILYDTIVSASQQYVWTADQNLKASAQVGLTDVSIDIYSVSWSNVDSAPINITASAGTLTTPVLSASNWNGDNGTASQNLYITWFGVDNANSYDVSLDGNLYNVKDTRITYSYLQNLRDHSPTLVSGDANITYTVKARSKINQVSALLSGQLTNTAPSGSMYSLATNVGFAQIGATISALSTYVVQDFDHYSWQLTTNSGQLVQQFNSTTPDVIFPLASGGIYTITARVYDKFNNVSNPIVASGLIADTLTIAQLRAEALYTDNINSSTATLNNLKDDDIATGVTYSATASGQWNWTKVERPTIDRYGVISLYAVGTATINFYVGLSSDDITYTWYSGSLSGTYGTTLTQVANESAAQTAAVTDGAVGLATYRRLDIPSIKEARFVKLHHRSNNGYTIRSYYPRRLIQTDDLQAETIKAINIAAAAITADKISVINLQAVSANMGALTMDGVISIGSSGGIYQGTGSFASPTTGLKIFNSSGVGKLSTYNATVEQITLDTDGKLKAGAGKVILSASGIQITANNTAAINDAKTIQWYDGSSNLMGGINANTFALVNDIFINTTNNGSRYARVLLQADGTAGNTAQIYIIGTNDGSPPIARVLADQIEAFITDAAGWFEIYNASSSVVFSVDNSGNVGVNGRYYGADATFEYASTAYNSEVGTIRVQYASNTNKKMYFGWDNSIGGSSLGAGYIQSVESTVAYRDIIMNAAGGNVGIGSTAPSEKLAVSGNINISGVYKVAGTQVITTRQTGWNAPTGTLTRGTFNSGATLATTAQTLAALITDLRTHGLIST